MRLFYLVQQQHCMRCLINSIGQHATLIKPYIARRRTDKTTYRVALHIFRHVETDHFHSHDLGQLTGHFCFAHARWA